MKIFLDCSDPDLIKSAFDTGLIDGVTTNPSLMLKAGNDPRDVIANISAIFPWDASISAEVVGDTAEEMLQMAEACKQLSTDEISVNVTLVFDTAQAILAAKAGATYVSPFVGRVFDQSFDGFGVIEEIADVFATHQAPTQVLAASIREVYQVSKSFKVGADICTIPITVFHKMYRHILTDKGLELFDNDWKQLQEKLK